MTFKRGIAGLLWLGAATFAAGASVVLLLVGLIAGEIPKVPDRLEQLTAVTPTQIFASDGSLLVQLGGRKAVPPERISQHFFNAVISAEDDGFFEHPGIDKPALVKAVAGVMLGKRSRGGSTITQQLTKNLFFSFEKTITRKFREILVALEIEREFEKDQILAAYCNWIPYGPRIDGVEEAARHYFGVHASELTPKQAALLAGLPNGPSRYNPYRHPDRARARRDWILNRMNKLGYISDAITDAALSDTVLHIQPQSSTGNRGNYFLDAVLEKLEKRYGENVVYHGGLKVYTTVDPLLQGYAEDAVRQALKDLDERFGKEEDYFSVDAEKRSEYPQGLLVAVESATGAVKALVGGRDWQRSQYNRALSPLRNKGSSLKPALYLTALEKLNYTPATVVVDSPITIQIPGSRPWSPRNFSSEHEGRLILKAALEKSINTVAAGLVQEVKPEGMIETLHRLGVKSEIEPHYAVALGVASVTPVEMAGMAASIANQGNVVEPFMIRRVEDARGVVLEEHFVSSTSRFDPETVYQLIDMMKGVVEEGTGAGVRRYGFNHPAIGKTGTTNDYRDSWFLGATPRLAAVAWVGFDDNRSMRIPGVGYITGASGGLPVWARFMKRATEGEPPRDFDVPEGIDFHYVDRKTGVEVYAPADSVLRVAVPDDVDLPKKPLKPLEVDSTLLPRSQAGRGERP